MITPPKRPNKSKLRNTVIAKIGCVNSNDDVSPKISLRSNPPPMMPAITEKSNHKSRFIEQIELGPNHENRPIRPKHKSPLRRASLKTSQSSITMASSSVMDEIHLPIDILTNTTVVSPKQRLKLSASKSTPLVNSTKSAPLLGQQRQYNYSKQLLTTSINRADIIISRLEGWHMFLKSIVVWLEEVSRINMASSRGYSQKAYCALDESSAFSAKTVHGQEYTEQVNDSILTIQTGLQHLTKRLAAKKKEQSQVVEKRYIPELTRLCKQVKERIHKLKTNSALAMDEWLKRAEVTRSKMATLNKCCKQAEKAEGPIETDPWLANLMVLKQLKRETEEENRLRLLMIPVQQEAKELEQKVLNLVKPAIEYCYKALAPNVWDGSDEATSTPFQSLLEQITPDSDWEKFIELNKTELVDEDNPIKDYLKINYPNKFHPLAMTVIKGKLDRKIGARKQFVSREFVLTQGCYLHEFTLGSKLTPEKTIYVPNVSIIPPVDTNQIVEDNALLEYGHSELTFDICKPSTTILQKDKVITFRASNKQELIQWCLALISKSHGISNNSQESVVESGFQNRFFPQSHQNSMKRKSLITTDVSQNSENPSTHVYVQHQHNLSTIKVDSTTSERYTQDNVEKTPTAATFSSTVAVEEAKVSLATDTESFVTARLNESDYPDENESGTIDDYFKYAGSDDDDDNASVQSNVTAKATTSGQVPHSPSLASTHFDDAQSSLYYSSDSRPPSPTISEHSSIAFIPEFEMLNRLIPTDDSSIIPNSTMNELLGKPSDADIYKSSVNLNFGKE